MLKQRVNLVYFGLLVGLFLALAVAIGVDSAEATPKMQSSNSCVIPPSGPWPACATSGAQSSNTSCVIPPSGPWPVCARNGGNGGGTTGGSSGGSGSANCVIPPSGPWPACAKSGNANEGGTNSGYGDCIIPPSGPWPACAKDGNSSPIQAPEGFCLDPNNPQGGHSAWLPCEAFAPVTPTPQPPNQPKLCPPPNGQGKWGLCDAGSGPAKVVKFEATIKPVGNGDDTIEYSWETSGATSVQLLVGLSDQWADHRVDIGSSGSSTTIYKSDALTSGQIGLKACRQSQCAVKFIKVNFSCTHSYFFKTTKFNPGSCSANTYRERKAVIQQFEHGMIIWIDDWGVPYEGRGPAVLVFAKQNQQNGGSLIQTLDKWTAGQAISDPSLTPPAGLRQPTHGIGKVWREYAGLRENLGWAVSAEIPYTAKADSEEGLGVVGSVNSFLSLADANKLIVISCGQRTSAGSCGWSIKDL